MFQVSIRRGIVANRRSLALDGSIGWRWCQWASRGRKGNPQADVDQRLDFRSHSQSDREIKPVGKSKRFWKKVWRLKLNRVKGGSGLHFSIGHICNETSYTEVRMSLYEVVCHTILQANFLSSWLLHPCRPSYRPLWAALLSLGQPLPLAMDMIMNMVMTMKWTALWLRRS